MSSTPHSCELLIDQPDLLPSPSSSILLRAGDCLDLSVVLCSMLRGVGYDAYVVAGQAPLWVTQCDQSAVDFDASSRRQIIEEIRPDGSGRPLFGSSLLPRAVESEAEAAASKAQRYQLKTQTMRESKFLALEREAAVAEAERQRLLAIAVHDEQARAAREMLYGQRAHCWVRWEECCLAAWGLFRQVFVSPQSPCRCLCAPAGGTRTMFLSSRRRV